MKNIAITLLCLLLASPVLAKNEGKKYKHNKLPPGQEKKLKRTGQLSPGWQKKLVRGQILEPKLYQIGKQNHTPLTNSPLKPRLGTEVLRIEDRIIRIKNDTREILEIIGIRVNP